jgi:hypothetical protein
MFNDSLPTYDQEAIGIVEPSENGVRKLVVADKFSPSLGIDVEEGEKQSRAILNWGMV